MSSSPWESVDLSPWEDNPEAFTGTPTGAAQVAPEVAAAQHAQESGQPLSPWASVDFTDASKSWFGGRNTSGERNGWDSDFYRAAVAQDDEWMRKAADAQSPSLYFQQFDTKVNKEATGVATWDDEARGIRAGDVFQGGKKVSNLVDDFGWRDAATMMAPLLFDGVEQQRLFEAGGVGDNAPLVEATQARLAERSQQALKAPTAEAFADLVDDKRDQFDDMSGWGSAAAGAGAGALMGSVIPGVGTAVGAVVGALAGGTAAWLNRDQMTELVARTQAQAEIASRQEGLGTAALAQLSGWSQVAMTAASPVQNTIQGVTDLTTGDLGDGASEFYEIDPATGVRKAPGWLQALNVVGSVGDAFAQFASAPARGLYYTTMGAQVAAGVGQVATDAVFDPTAGEYHQLEGVGERAAAWTSVGIDAVQMGVARALVRSTAGQRALVGADEEAVVRTALGRATDRARAAGGVAAGWADRGVDRLWAGMRGKALPENYVSRDVNGVRYFFGEDLSSPVAMRLTAQLLAPSELFKWLPNAARARMRTAASNGMPTADDMYTAALSTVKNGNRLSTAVVNGFAESSEELAQAYLDPQAYGESASQEDLVLGATMGFAAGMGMSLGTTLKAPGMAQRAQLAARRNLEAAFGLKFDTEEQWRQFSEQIPEDQLRVWAAADTEEQRKLAESAAKFSELHTYETGTTNTAGTYAAVAILDNAERAAWMRSVPNPGGMVVALPRTNAFYVVGDRLIQGEFEANEAVASLWRVADVLTRKLESTRLHVDEAQSRLAETQNALAQATDPDQQQRLTLQAQEIGADIADMGDAILVQERLVEALMQNWEAFRSADTSTERAAILESVNTALRSMGRGLRSDGSAPADDAEAERNKRAVELFYGRHPFMDAGSIVRYVPQVSLAMSEQNQHGSIHLPQTSLKAMGADYDGDFLASLNAAYVPPAQRRMFRLGGQYLPSAVTGEPITSEPLLVDMSIDVPDAEEMTLDRFRQYFLDPAGVEAQFVTDELAALEQWVVDRYVPVLGRAAVDAAFAAFRDDVRGGNPKARLKLANALANADLQKFIRMGEATSVPEANHLMERVSLSLEQLSMRIAQHNHTNLDFDTNLTPAQVTEQRAFMKDRPALMADTYGAMIALSLSQDGQRSAQQLNYIALIQSAIDLVGVVDTGATITDTIRTLAYEYARLSSGSAITMVEEIDATDIVGTTVRTWLRAAAQQFRRDNSAEVTKDLSDDELMLLVGSLQVRAFNMTQDAVELEDGTVSVLQMLLRAAVQQEEARLTARREPKDSPVSLALQRMKRLTYEQKEGHSYSASAAMLAVFGPGRISQVLPNSYHLIDHDTTVDVIVSQITSKHESRGRKQRLDQITKMSPEWNDGAGDPPYTLEDILTKRITPYTVFANAVKAVANNHDKNLSRRNETAHATALKAVESVRRYIDTQFDEVAVRLRERAGSSSLVVTREDVLAELLTYDQAFGREIVQLLPIDSLRATFARDPGTGRLVPAKWLSKALLQENSEKALVMLYWHSVADHMRLLAAGVKDFTDEDVDALGTAAAVEAAGIPFDKLTSRTEQLIMLAQYASYTDGGLKMLEIQRAMDADTLEQSFELLNSSPLRGDMAPLLPWYDSVSEFELRPTDLYSRGMSSATLREQYLNASKRLDQMATSKALEVSARAAERADIKEMQARLEELGGRYDELHNPEMLGLPAKPVDDMLRRLHQQIRRAPYLVDGVGYTSRNEALDAVWNGVLVMHNKGAGDPALSLVGGFLPLLTSFGLKQGFFQEVDNLTTFGSEDVLSNMSKLLEGPTRVTFLDGSHTVIDMTTVAGVVDLLADPTTNALAKTAITPLVRDVTINGTSQMYTVYQGNEQGYLTISSILQEASNAQYVRNGSRPTLEHSHALLSQIEGMAMRMAEALPTDATVERQAATLSVQNMLNDFLVAYAVGPQRGGSPEAIRDNLVRGVTQSLIEISQLSPEVRERTRDLIKAKLIRQLLSDSTMMEYLSVPADIREMFNESMEEEIKLEVDEKLSELRRAKLASTDQAEKIALQAEIDRLQNAAATLSPLEQMLELDQRTFIDIARARAMFTIDWSDPDRAQADAQRVVKFLTTNGRLLHFRQPKMMTLIHNIEGLAPLFKSSGSVTLDKLTREGWDTAAELAARAYTQDRLGLVASTVGFSALQTDQDDAYFDPTYSFLVDELFNDRLLDAMSKMLEVPEYNMGDAEGFNSESVSNRVLSNLLNPDLISVRAPEYPAMAMQVRKALAVTPVQYAVPQAGDNPKGTADAQGASIRSFRLPLDEHFSNIVLFAKAGEQLKKRIVETGDPGALIKLEHHYIRKLTITNRAGLIPATHQDALLKVGRTGLDPETESSGLMVLSLDRLQDYLDGLTSDFGATEFDIEVEYVDIEKLPYERAWANNVYFDGAGREFETHVTNSLIASLMYSTEGLNKKGQQIPLEYSKKPGSGFLWYVMQGRMTVQQIEEQAPSVADMLYAKTLNILQRPFETGYLQLGDIPAIHKYLRMRHAVRRVDAEGVERLMMADEAIALEAAEKAAGQPVSEFTIVPLSEMQARTLWANNSRAGIAGVLTHEPVLNPQDVDPFPQLTPEKLRATGLTRLGMAVPVNNTELAQVVLPPPARLKDIQDTRRGARLFVPISRDYTQVLQERMQLRGFDIGGLNAKHDALIASLFTRDRGLQRLLGASSALYGIQQGNASQALAQASRMLRLSDSNVTLLYQMGDVSRFMEGVLTPVDLQNDFGWKTDKGLKLALGDAVILDLGNVLEFFRGDQQAAYDHMLEVLHALGKRGVRLVFQSTGTGANQLRSDLVDWIEQDGIPYQRMADSRNFFEPSTERNQLTNTQRAERRSLSQVRVFTGRGAELALLATDESALHDGATYFRWETAEDWQADVVVQFPSHLTHTSAGRGREYTFGLAIDTPGESNIRAKLVADLLPILTTAQGRASLGIEDPAGVPIRRVTVAADGTEILEPGIVDAESALLELERVLSSAGEDLYTGRTLRAGDFIPYVGSQGAILLHRVGFELPKDADIYAALDNPPVEYGGADRPLKIIVSKPSIEHRMTLPPDFQVEQLFYTPNGIRATGTARVDRNMKAVLQGLGGKLGMAEMPSHFHLVTDPISREPGNNLRISYIVGESSLADKGGLAYRVDNFTDAFSVFGVSFKQDLMDFFGKDWDAVSGLLEKWSHQGLGLDERDVLEILQAGNFYDMFRNELHGTFEGVLPTDAIDSMFSEAPGTVEDPKRRIAQVVLATLLLPGVRLEHVLGTTGLMSLTSLQSDAEVLRMPEIMGMAFDDRYRFPQTFDLLMDRLNSRIKQDAQGGTRALTKDWKFSYSVQYPDGSFGQREGVLQYVLPVPAQQNVLTYTQRYVLSGKNDVSQHTAAVLSAALGARLPDRPLARKVKDGQARIDSDTQRWLDGALLPTATDEASVRSMFGTGWFNPNDPVYDSWGMLNYAEHAILLRGTAEASLYLQSIDTSGWAEESPLDASAVETLMSEVLRTLNLEHHKFGRRLLHQLIRMDMGIAGPRQDQDPTVGRVSVADAKEALTNIKENLARGDMPTLGGSQMLLHADTLRLLFEAQSASGVTDPWSPRIVGESGGAKKFAKSWDDWVLASIAQAFEADGLYEAMNVPALHGFWQSYNAVSSLTQTLSVTPDVAQAAGLRAVGADKSVRDLVSFSEVINDAAATPIITEVMDRSLDALTGKTTTFAGSTSLDTPASRRAYHAKRRASWRAKRQMAKQDPEQSLKDLRQNGLRLLENNNRQNVFFRNVALFSLMNRMLNPGIWVSALFEVPFRRLTDHVTDRISGKTLDRLYTDDEVRLIDDLVRTLGDNALFMAEIQKQLTYQVVGARADSKGRITNALEKGAAWGVRWMSDPWSGMQGTPIAREYIKAVLEHLAVTNNAITVKQLVQEMKTDPLWLKEQFGTQPFNPHTAGMNRVAQTRAMKQTMLSKPVIGTINSLCARPSVGANIAGHLLRIPFMFTLYTTNALMTMTGLEGWDQAAAMFFHGRQKPKFLRSAKNRALGDSGDVERWDFSDVIETLDLQRTFIRSGVTVSMLMALGLMAGNLGLDGDDEEARRRKRLAKYLNVPLLNDPYEPQNSFKYARAIFLDSIPGLDMIFKDSRGEAAVVPHWIIRQFTSPILGAQRFFDTGDMREIAYGFWDAFSVMPRSFLSLWDGADVFASQLADAAESSSQYDSVEMRANTNQLIVGIASVYEKAVLENSFVNSLYVAKDDFDRDPYIIPRITDTGQIMRQQGTGIPVPTDATQTVIGPDGEPIETYMKRTSDQALLFSYTENNATAAVISSLFSGMAESPYLRQNMGVKQQTIELPQLNADQAKALVLSAYLGSGGEFRLNKLDIVRILKQQISAAGGRWDQATVENQADAILAAHDPRTALSIGTEQGEVLTQYGAERIYASLMKGTIKLGDPTLAGLAVPREVREKVAKSLLEELIQDGLDLGLSYESAVFVAQRFWYGDKTNPDVPGLRDLLESPLIPEINRVKYNQLNVLYAIGPDGRPWATPFERVSTLQALGIPVPHRVETPGPGTHLDNLGNVVDDVLGINTGLSAIVRQPTKKIKLNDPFKKLSKNQSAGTGSYGRRYGRGSGGGSGYGYGPSFQRMYELAGGTSPRFGGIPMINTSNPYIRRAQVNRERVFGERGRLKQWQ